MPQIRKRRLNAQNADAELVLAAMQLVSETRRAAVTEHSVEYADVAFGKMVGLHLFVIADP